MPSQAYFEGDFYYCIAPAGAGDSPSSSPEKWVKIEIPNQLRSPIASLAAARLFAQEDNLEQSGAAELLGRNRLDEAIFNDYLAPKGGVGVRVTRT